MTQPTASTVQVPVLMTRQTGSPGAIACTAQVDLVAVEEPLEIRLEWGEPGARRERAISVTMRTPGQDEDLAVGFLYTEGIIRGSDDVASCVAGENVVRVLLAPGVCVDLGKLERNFYVTSSCGVCGKASIDAIHVRRQGPSPPDDLRVEADVIRHLPASLRRVQS
ncbi:MAG: formate dehydrogenase accessory sulfurtransferase FdhD, partial [Polyangiaceae bacterium]|nr:formate dehydrogenase accessory sulfurtransferase FdhD [Polyangiaceae bacterium]